MKDKMKFSTNDDGELFEYKVALILKKEFPKYNFVHTSYKNDGGKDFYSTTSDEKIWVEAKCYNRHLEMSKIAGTFIMADICQINKIIIFSKTKLAAGTFINLAKYCSNNNKSLIIYNGDDINNLIIKNKKITIDEIKSIDKKYDNFDKFINLTNEKIEEAILTKRIQKRYDSEYYCLLMAFSYKDYNDIAVSGDKLDQDLGIQKFGGTFYLENNFAKRGELKNEINAFDVFSVEFVIRNPSLSKIKAVNIHFNVDENYCKCLTNKCEQLLEPGRCIAIKYYFRAMNSAKKLLLPQPIITCEKKKFCYKILVNNKNNINCRLIGETPYLGIDCERLSQLNINLCRFNRKFCAALVYGKSGVGKTRFLSELRNVRMQKGNLCFLINNDLKCLSIFDFIRQLIISYYDFDFDENTGKIKIPDNYPDKKTLDFIINVLNNTNKKIDVSLVSRWLISFIKNKDVTILIDNAQNLSKEIFSLLDNIISSLSMCECNSEIIFAFNTDMIIPKSVSSTFFTHYKTCIPNEFRFQLEGFDKDCAITYLKCCLDPFNVRTDVANICYKIVDTMDTNPLFLKQIILYLYQKKIIGFVNNSICILSMDLLMNALCELPENINDIIKYRIDLLFKSKQKQLRQITDLFWSIIVFKALPTYLIDCIVGIKKDTLKECFELGFIKHGENDTIRFEHQLIEKAILIILQKEAYTPNPVVNKIELRKRTASQFLNKLLENKTYKIAKFLIVDYLKKVTEEYYNEFLINTEYHEVDNNLFPLISRLMLKYNKSFYLKLSQANIVKGIHNVMIACQDRLGSNKTYIIFTKIIDYEINNYKNNINCVNEFIELIRYYFHEMPNNEKYKFIIRFEKIGDFLFKKNNDFIALSDFQIWVKWAIGKNQMHLHNFNEAFCALKEGINLAKKADNSHRLAELYVQLGYLYAYVDNKNNVANCWKKAYNYYNSKDIHSIVVKLTIRGNAALIEKDFNFAEKLCKKLISIYNMRNCYSFLKTYINDFICNFLILKAVRSEEYDESIDNQIKTYLSQYRSVAMTYKTDHYLRAIYKSLTYYKYNLTLFFKSRPKSKNKADIELIRIFCKELIANYKYNDSDFTFFYPIFKDIADIARCDEIVAQFINDNAFLSKKYIEFQNSKELMDLMNNRHGVLSDEKRNVNLYHFTYTW